MQNKIISSLQSRQIIQSINISPKIVDSEEKGQCYMPVYDGSVNIRFLDGSQYIGLLLNGYFHGKGTYIWPDNTQITMKFIYNKFDGQAQIIFPNGDTYDGEVYKGLRNGYGLFKSKEFTYKGNYLNGKKQGRGILTNDQQQVYDGYFVLDNRQGQGSFTYSNGNFYNGNWLDNKKHGFGCMQWKTQCYKGNWVNNIPEGVGELIWLDDKIEGKLLRNRYYGNWKNGQRDGYGTFYYADGSKYEGQWKNNLKQGNAIFTNELGVSEIIYFFNDKKQIKQENLIQNQNLLQVSDIITNKTENQKIQKMLLRNHQLLNQIFKFYSNFNLQEEKNNNLYSLRLFQVWQLLKDAKQLNFQKIN